MDLEGISRDRSVREELRGKRMVAPKNSFIDINNPPREAYRHQDYPKMQYHADGRIVKVSDEMEELDMNEQGFGSVVFPEYDYNSIVNGRAKLKEVPAEAADVEYPQNEAAEIDAEEAEVVAKIAELGKKGKKR